MIRRPPRSTPSNSSAASDVYKRQTLNHHGRTHTWATYDIKDFYGSYDDDEFFFHVKLNGEWDDNHQVHDLFPFEWWDVWHLMAIPILNNEAEFRDSLFYAVVIADANLLVINIQDGLYKFWKPGPDDDDPLDNYERLSDLTFSSGPDGSSGFSVRVPIDSLTSDDWGSWPNATEGIGTGCATVSAWLAGTEVEYQITDVTQASGMYCYTQDYTIGTNTAPNLLAALSYELSRDSLWVDFNCEYSDADNNLPTVRRLEVDTGAVATYPVGTPDHIYSDGAEFEHELLYRCYWTDTLLYRWVFNDGSGDVTTPWTQWAFPDEISLVLSTTSWDLRGPDSLTANETVTMSDADGILITNIGNVPVDFGIAVSDPPPGWVLDDHQNWDTTTVWAHFDDNTTVPAFNSDDIVDELITWADGLLLGGGEGVSFCVDGANTERLWMKFTVPRYYSGYGDQTMTVQLWARTDLP